MGVFGLLGALFSIFSLTFLFGFISNLSFLPKTVDSGGSWLPLCSDPYCNNVFFYLIFAIHHSGMILSSVSTYLKSILPKGTFLSLYSITASLALLLLCFGWKPLPGIVWSLVDIPLLYTIVTGLNVLCLLFLICSAVSSSPVENAVFSAIRKLLFPNSRKPFQSGVLITDGVYSYIRHPLMAGLLSFMWIRPHMSIGLLLYCCLSTVYVFGAVVLLEEPKLIQQFGDPYRQYMKKVARFVPGLI